MFEEAVEISKKMLNSQLNILGENNEDIAFTYRFIAICLANKGDIELALNYLEKALNIRKNVCGDRSYGLLNCIRILLSFIIRQKNMMKL